MQRQYATILPKKPSTEDDDVASDNKPEGQKKRRIGVSVACDRCRARKIRCDGLRPVCTNCHGKSNRCTYRDEGGLSVESSKLVLEIFQLLNQLSAKELVQLIHSVKDEQNAWAIVLALRSFSADSSQHTNGYAQDSVEKSDLSPLQLELQLQNLIAYPPAAVAETTLLETQPYQQLVEAASSTASITMSISNQGQHADHLHPNHMPLDDINSSQSFQHTPNTGRLSDTQLNEPGIIHWTDADNTLATSSFPGKNSSVRHS